MTITLYSLIAFISFDTENFTWGHNNIKHNESFATIDHLSEVSLFNIQDKPQDIQVLEKEVSALEEKARKAIAEKDPNAKNILQELQEKQESLAKLRIEEERKKQNQLQESKFSFMINLGTFLINFDNDLGLETRFGTHFRLQKMLFGPISAGIIHNFVQTELNTETTAGDITQNKWLFEIEINQPGFSEQNLYFSAGVSFGTGILNISNDNETLTDTFGDEHSQIGRLSMTANWKTLDRFYIKFGPIIEFEKTDFGRTSAKTFKNYAVLVSLNFNW